MEKDTGIKQQLVNHLNGGEAFMSIDEMLKEIQYNRIGERPKDLPYSFYELFYHIWYTQKDLLDYCTKEEYHAPEWPKDYWPGNNAPESPEDWEKLKSDYLEDRQRLSEVILDDKNTLTDTVPSSPKHTFLRSILLVIEHSAYHTGQLLIVLRHLGLHTT